MHFMRRRKLNEIGIPNSSPKWDVKCPVTIATFFSGSRTNQVSDALYYCNCEHKMDCYLSNNCIIISNA